MSEAGRKQPIESGWYIAPKLYVQRQIFDQAKLVKRSVSSSSITSCSVGTGNAALPRNTRRVSCPSRL